MTNQPLSEEAALKKAARYCSTAEHCRAEVAEKLRQWGVPASSAEQILTRLVQERFIDEERFCRAFVNDKHLLAKWGKRGKVPKSLPRLC